MRSSERRFASSAVVAGGEEPFVEPVEVREELVAWLVRVEEEGEDDSGTSGVGVRVERVGVAVAVVGGRCSCVCCRISE